VLPGVSSAAHVAAATLPFFSTQPRPSVGRRPRRRRRSERCQDPGEPRTPQASPPRAARTGQDHVGMGNPFDHRGVVAQVALQFNRCRHPVGVDPRAAAVLASVGRQAAARAPSSTIDPGGAARVSCRCLASVACLSGSARDPGGRVDVAAVPHEVQDFHSGFACGSIPRSGATACGRETSAAFGESVWGCGDLRPLWGRHRRRHPVPVPDTVRRDRRAASPPGRGDTRRGDRARSPEASGGLEPRGVSRRARATTS
jgi:hypothetical protein